MLNNSLSNKIPKFNFHDNTDIINLGDVHYGNVACNKKFFKQILDFIKSNSNVYWLSTGDILDVNISKSKFYDSEGLELNEEFNEITDLLQPISNKCLGFVGSNHSDRIQKLAGVNFDQILAKVLNIKYLGGMGLINCTLSTSNTINHAYYIAMTHGRSNAMTIGSKANSMQRISDMFANIDLALEGHTHTYMTSIKEVQVIDRAHNKLKTNKVTMCVCGHCLEWAKSYAPDGKYSPTPLGFPMFTLDKKIKDIEVTFLTPTNL
jgi:hypothetical protein